VQADIFALISLHSTYSCDIPVLSSFSRNRYSIKIFTLHVLTEHRHLTKYNLGLPFTLKHFAVSSSAEEKFIHSDL